MRAMSSVVGRAVSLPDADVDTDIIYPARFLLITEKRGLGQYAFAERRTEPGFPIDEDNDRPILIAGPNFGCGSSREQAAWALDDLGFRVIIAERFGEIFYGNCFRNGILPIRLDADDVAVLRADAERDEQISIDLTTRTIASPNLTTQFEVAEDRREALMKGWNDTLRILALNGQDIARFEAAQQQAAPWLWTTRN